MAKTTTSSVNYAKRGWKWLGLSAIIFCVYGLLANQVDLGDSLITVMIIMLCLVAVGTVISSYNFARVKGLYIVLSVLAGLITIIAVWLSIFAYSY